MCKTGVHVGQLKLMIEQTDDGIGLALLHLERLTRFARDAGSPNAASHLADATRLVGEARRTLSLACDELEHESASVVRVELA